MRWAAITLTYYKQGCYLRSFHDFRARLPQAIGMCDVPSRTEVGDVRYGTCVRRRPIWSDVSQKIHPLGPSIHRPLGRCGTCPRLVGAVLAEPDDEWGAADRRYFSAEPLKVLTQPPALPGRREPLRPGRGTSATRSASRPL